MIKDKVEINIPTYNRGQYLEHTLSKLLDSPFFECSITIFDNCSTDNTSCVCDKYKSLFPNFKVVKHMRNIGMGANIINAYQNGSKLYNWVLGDNDDFDFSECSDLIEAIDSENYDMLLICSPGFPNYLGKNINEVLINKNLKENFLEFDANFLLNNLGFYYFYSLSFISIAIYKSDLFDSECFIKGYDNIPNKYPHFQFLIKSIEKNFSMYKSNKDIILPQKNEDYKGNIRLYWDLCWLNTCLMIKDTKLRKIAANFTEGSSFFVTLGLTISSKVYGEENYNENLISLVSVMIKLKGWFKGSLCSIVILLASLIPKSIGKRIYTFYKKRNGEII